MSITSFQTCNICGAKCCKPNLVTNSFNLNLAPGDFSNLYKNGLGAFLSVGHDEELGVSFIISPHVFGYCPFLDFSTNKCMIYSNRPVLCRNFPFDSDIKNPVKESCLILKNTPTNEIMKSEVRGSTSDTLGFKKKEEEDQDVYFSQFKNKITLFESTETYISNKFGSFILRGQPLINTFGSPWNLLKEYVDYFSLKQIIINFRIIDKENNEIIKVEGVFKPGFEFTKREINTYVGEQAFYYTDVYDGSYLEGILYLTDLDKPYYYWHPLWDELNTIFLRFKSQKF